MVQGAGGDEIGVVITRQPAPEAVPDASWSFPPAPAQISDAVSPRQRQSECLSWAFPRWSDPGATGARIGMLFARKTAMTHAPCRAAIAMGIFSSLFAMSCAKDGLGTGGGGGAIAGTGGAIAGTGGAVAGTGGAIAGTGGAIAGTGGAIAGTGGAITGAGGTGGNRGSGGSSAATGGTTTTRDAGPQGCVANGRTYAIGETFKVDCNTCTCTVSGIACTEMACVYDARPDQPSGPDVGSCLCPLRQSHLRARRRKRDLSGQQSADGVHLHHHAHLLLAGGARRRSHRELLAQLAGVWRRRRRLGRNHQRRPGRSRRAGAVEPAA